MTLVEITYRDFGTHWEAWINGGWWVGRGETQQEAHKAVMKRFNSESEHFTGKTYEFDEQGKPIQMELFE